LLLQALGLAMYLLSTAFIMWVFRENSFAAPVVKVQAARHHRVISSGPYAFVRHPMYSGIMLFFAGVPLLLGSWWGVADRAGVRHSVRHSRPHRGARAGRGTA
jgi:protein-S-isoprenylcysteine O-methyltransferase Ste14